jgi:hypothetical protein
MGWDGVGVFARVCGVLECVKAEGVGDSGGQAGGDGECGHQGMVGRGRRHGSGQFVMGVRNGKVYRNHNYR